MWKSNPNEGRDRARHPRPRLWAHSSIRLSPPPLALPTLLFLKCSTCGQPATHPPTHTQLCFEAFSGTAHMYIFIVCRHIDPAPSLLSQSVPAPAALGPASRGIHWTSLWISAWLGSDIPEKWTGSLASALGVTPGGQGPGKSSRTEFQPLSAHFSQSGVQFFGSRSASWGSAPPPRTACLSALHSWMQPRRQAL